MRSQLLLGVLAVLGASAEECNPGNVTAELPPGFLSPGVGGVSIWMEVSEANVGHTYLVREVYDKKRNTYLLEYFKDGQGTKTMLVNRDTNFTIVYTNQTCEGIRNDELWNTYKNMPFMHWLRIPDLPEVGGFIGPAVKFEQFAMGLADGQERGRLSTCDLERAIPCVNYRECLPDGSKIDYYYSKAGYKMFGRNQSLPIRLVTGMGAVNLEILNIEVYDEDSSPNLFVPTGLSCRMSEHQESEVPLESGTHEFEGEIIYAQEGLDRIYISQLSGMQVKSTEGHAQDTPGIYTFTYSTWENNLQQTDVEAGARVREIFDHDHKMYYRHLYEKDAAVKELHKSSCDKSVTFESQRPVVPMPPVPVDDPHYDEIDLFQLLVELPTSNVYKLGDNQMRAVDTEVYEATFIEAHDGRPTTRLVATYHFVKQMQQLHTIELRHYTDKLEYTATIHITKFESEVKELNEKLKVENCYSKSDPEARRWFQVGFELLNRNDSGLIAQSEHEIKEKFLDKLYRSFELQPMRIPQVSVAILEEQVKVSVLLLERKAMETQFVEPMKKDFIKPSKVLGVMSKDACLAACLSVSEKKCTAVSHCGAVCSMSDAKNPAAASNLNDDEECSMFARASTHTIPVSAQVISDIKESAEAKDSVNRIRFSINVADTEVELMSDTFDDTLDFESAFHYEQRRAPIVEKSFNLIQTKKKYTDGEDRTDLGSFSLEDCAYACKNREECGTFSYCENSRDCIVSTNHDVVVNNTLTDNYCVIYQLKYSDRFEKFPGMTIKPDGKTFTAKNEDSCAKLCIDQSDCKSFEYCTEGDKSDNNCVLSTSHVRDNPRSIEQHKENEKKQSCSHYSKMFLYDYTRKMKAEGGGNVLSTEYHVTEAACSKLCSEWADPKTVCLSFDFCARLTDGTGKCVLRDMKGTDETKKSSVCDFYYIGAQKPDEVTRTSAGGAVGLSILMMVIGVGLGIAGIIVYQRFYP